MQDIDLYPKQLFHERLEVMGDLVSGDNKCPNLHIVIQYQLDKPSNTVGHVYGKQEDADRLSRFLRENASLKLVARSRFGLAKPYGYTLECAEVYVTTVVSRSEPEGATYNIAKIVIHKLTQRQLFDTSFVVAPETARDLPKRFLTFHLAGPSNVWGMYWFAEKSFTGNTKVELCESEIDLARSLPFSVDFVPWFLNDETDEPDKHDVQVRVYAYTLKTSSPVTDYSDGAFLEEGLDTVNKLVSLSSLATGSRVNWYGYSLKTNDSYVKYRRSILADEEEEFDRDSLIVNHPKLKEFLIQSYNRLCDNPEVRDVLNVSLEYYLSGLTKEKGIDERFILLFLALERIKDIFAKRHNLTQLLPKKEFDEFRNRLKALTYECLRQEDSRLVCEKANELNRASFRRVAQTMFQHYGIDTSDLYPDGEDPFGFVRTRNILFHSRNEIADNLLYKESKRLEYVLARLFLRILDWQDLRYTPDPHNVWRHELRRK